MSRKFWPQNAGCSANEPAGDTFPHPFYQQSNHFSVCSDAKKSNLIGI
ncbi:MAG TPA: hypothetical protein PLO83_11635 [Gammaproteobacteria bacterium]|nr:hypothetical protein [Gammaproteobacteria bacterium]